MSPVPERVVLGMDPHKRSATIEALAADEVVLGGGRFGTDRDGYAAMLRYAKQWQDRVWAIEGCSGIGRQIAHRPLADGEEVVDVLPQAVELAGRSLAGATRTAGIASSTITTLRLESFRGPSRGGTSTIQCVIDSLLEGVVVRRAAPDDECEVVALRQASRRIAVPINGVRNSRQSSPVLGAGEDAIRAGVGRWSLSGGRGIV